MTPIDEAVALIRRANSIAIATHATPDPDAIGTLLGLGAALRSAGKRVAMLCDDVAPPSVAFLPGVDEVSQALPDGFQPGLFVGVDASDPQRLGKVSEPLLSGAIPVLNIDHHVTNLNFGGVNVVHPTASSCAEVIVILLDALNITITPDIATCLMAGLVGDTRGFSTSSVTPDTLLAGARLLQAGANLPEINGYVLSRHSLDGLRLWGLALSSVHLEDGIAWASVVYAERQAARIPEISDTGLSNLLLTIPQARVSAVFMEQEDGLVSVSMRARSGYDVAILALSLGGGGHPAAAGCTIDGPLDSAVEQVMALLKTATKTG